MKEVERVRLTAGVDDGVPYNGLRRRCCRQGGTGRPSRKDIYKNLLGVPVEK